MNFLQGHGTNVMDSPAFSADVTPIEHIWDELGRRVRNRVPPPAASDTYTRMEQYSKAEHFEHYQLYAAAMSGHASVQAMDILVTESVTFSFGVVVFKDGSSV